MSINEEREAEAAKYNMAYSDPGYHMKGQRRDECLEMICNTVAAVRELTPSSPVNLLDVGCGRGEVLNYAQSELGLVVRGVEVVQELIDADERVSLGYAHALPFHDGAFDVVTCMDVLEHLVPADTEAVLRELRRVAQRAVVVTVNNKSTIKQGVELHVNRRPYEEWRKLLDFHVGKDADEREWWPNSYSPMWSCVWHQ